jgi:uncharacterized protein (TIGR02466 family)
MKFEILSLFSKPIVCLNEDKIDLDNAILSGKELDFVRTESYDVSVDTYVLNRPEFADLKKIAESSIEFFVRDVCRIANNIEFYITNSWYNKFKHMDSMRKHHHNNSMISGVIYLQTNESSGPISFHNDHFSNQLFPPNVDMEYVERNIFNATQHTYLPKPKDIVLFPSYMLHSVGTNRENERHCIAFNAFVRGSFGLIHELEIK